MKPEDIEGTQHKCFSGLDLKKDKPGSFTARIATLNVIDKDGDVTLPGAFPQGKSILISAYMHSSWMDSLPVGKGVIREDGNEVFVDGMFYLNTSAGKEHYETIKNAPELQEWSYGFRILEVDLESDWANNPKVWRVLKRLDVFEASPVLRGAGVNTGTTAIKSEGKTYSDQAVAVLAAAKDLAERTRALAALRQEDGRTLSAAKREEIEKLLKSFDELSVEMKALSANPPPQPDKAEVERLFLSCKRLTTKILLEVS